MPIDAGWVQTGCWVEEVGFLQQALESEIVLQIQRVALVFVVGLLIDSRGWLAAR